jgi:hypothetical protein
MAAEFSLSQRITEIISESYGFSGTTPAVFMSENDMDAWRGELDSIAKKPYGELIKLVRNDGRFELLVPTLADHERMNAIRIAHLHDNPANLRKLYGDTVRETTRNVPLEWRKLVEEIAIGFRRTHPNEQALEALRIAKKLLISERVEWNPLSPLEKFKRVLGLFSQP